MVLTILFFPLSFGYILPPGTARELIISQQINAVFFGGSAVNNKNF
jgi:hypothetical protein